MNYLKKQLCLLLDKLNINILLYGVVGLAVLDVAIYGTFLNHLASKASFFVVAVLILTSRILTLTPLLCASAIASTIGGEGILKFYGR